MTQIVAHPDRTQGSIAADLLEIVADNARLSRENTQLKRDKQALQAELDTLRATIRGERRAVVAAVKAGAK